MHRSVLNDEVGALAQTDGSYAPPGSTDSSTPRRLRLWVAQGRLRSPLTDGVVVRRGQSRPPFATWAETGSAALRPRREARGGALHYTHSGWLHLNSDTAAGSSRTIIRRQRVTRIASVTRSRSATGSNPEQCPRSPGTVQNSGVCRLFDTIFRCRMNVPHVVGTGIHAWPGASAPLGLGLRTLMAAAT
jgi:hypothetical protein